MRFVHIADMHFDTPFKMLSDRRDLGDTRRLAQRKAFKKMIEYIKENKIPYLFIAGDLYDNEYVRESTISFINDCFKQIPYTKVYIAPGNHDPYLKNSYYAKYNWNENVKIFTANVEKVENGDFILYGYGFEDFYCNNSDIENIKLEDKEKINILLTHCNLDGSDTLEKKYNNLSSKKLKEIGFDYVAIGHIHKKNIEEKTNIIYPGSTISLGFDELGKHGMVVGNLEKEKLNIEFIPLDENEFKEQEFDISEIQTVEELAEKINELNLEQNNLYKIILTGSRNFEINIYKIYKLIETENIIKIKDKTKISYNLSEIANDSTLKGIFAKEMLEKLKDENIDKEIIEKAIEIGISSLS